MRPYGERDKFRYNYIDCHPKKGYVNWWELESGDNNKRERRNAKKEIDKYLKFLRYI